MKDSKTPVVSLSVSNVLVSTTGIGSGRFRSEHQNLSTAAVPMQSHASLSQTAMSLRFRVLALLPMLVIEDPVTTRQQDRDRNVYSVI